MRHNRIYYRNPFFHIGHLQTLFYNDTFARENKGTCYSIIDDRQHPECIKKITDDFAYIGLTSTVVIPISKFTDEIHRETQKIVQNGKIYMICGKNTFTNADYINACLNDVTVYFQLKLKSDDTIIGFVKENNGVLTVVYLFDYIIKILDIVLNITDVTSDLIIKNKHPLPDLFTTVVNVMPINLYKIEGFRYTKKNWPTDEINDPCLLTLKGMKARGIPREVLHLFYTEAVAKGCIRISRLDDLFHTYLTGHSIRINAIVNPLEVKVHQESWYIDRDAFGMDCPHKLLKDRSCQLMGGLRIKCTSVLVNETGPYCLMAELLNAPDEATEKESFIDFIKSTESIKVQFKCYNWYYTGDNNIMKPIIYNGYIDAQVLKDPAVMYALPQGGYCSFEKDNTFTCIF
jgi:hypothetical protein